MDLINFIIQAKTVDAFNLVVHIFIMIFGFFFAYYTSDFLNEQYEAITENQTTVETYKNMVGRPVSDKFLKLN